MKPPREYQRELLAFIASVVDPTRDRPSPSLLAMLCGQFCRRWFGCSDIPDHEPGWEVTELKAWSERLGKHVGEFFQNQKEG